MDPLAPHNLLQDFMMQFLSPAVMDYITDVLSPQVHQWEKENDAIPTVTKPYLAWVE